MKYLWKISERQRKVEGRLGNAGAKSEMGKYFVRPRTEGQEGGHILEAGVGEAPQR